MSIVRLGLISGSSCEGSARPVSLLALGALVVGVLCAAVSPSTAAAFAAVSPAPVYSSASGLPDNRVYEQVSPADKNGNNAGAASNGAGEGEGQVLGFGGYARYALAAPDGNGVLFEGSGAMGETAAGYNLFFEAQRSASGWSTRGILPRAQGQSAQGGTLALQPASVDPSADLTHVMFHAHQGLFAPPPNPQCGKKGEEGGELYLGDSNAGFANATWLDRPQTPNPVENCTNTPASGGLVGGTPDFSTVYFTYPGTLLPEDAARVPHANQAWGLYEYSSGGGLREAGVLPDGSLDPFGAVPAASQTGRTVTGNQVSADGSRLFFVSPDPESCVKGNNCAVDPPELYVRENGDKTLLVSQDTLLPKLGGLPASAPGGVSEMFNPTPYTNAGTGVVAPGGPTGSDVFASPDGSQAFFQSEDKLTADAPEGPPGNVSPKTYDFDVNTGSLTYLPGVVGEIETVSADGSSMVFLSPGAVASPAVLELWSAGPGGGTVTPITQLTGQTTRSYPNLNRPPLDVAVARMSTDGSAVVFMTGMSLPGAFNSGTGVEQVYRYDVPANTISCVSCPPVGVAPTSNAELSTLQANEEEPLDGDIGMVDERGVSDDGDRVFFDTADPLVPQDTDGTRDVYEWENGTVYLLSSGRSLSNNYFLDSSENGGDVFFATTDGLVPGDTDGAYDVYDARVPHPGDNPPVAAVPCQGSVCQGPPRVPVPLGAPASATFSGLGSVVPEPVTTPPQTVAKKKTVKCPKGKKLSHGKCVKEKMKAKKAGDKRRVRS
jgi:hypothetical protein